MSIRAGFANKKEGEELGVEGILELPQEILMDILSRLSVKDLTSMSRTCSEFKNLCNDPSLWTRLSISWKHHSMDNDNTIEKLLKRFPQLKELSVPLDQENFIVFECQSLDKDKKDRFSDKSPHPFPIPLPPPRNNPDFELINKLQEIYTESKVFRQQLKKIVKNSKETLTSLQIEIMCDRDILEDLSKCKKLKKLEIRSLYEGIINYHVIVGKTFRETLSKLSQLQEMRIICVNENFGAIASNLTKLRKVFLKNCGFLLDGGGSSFFMSSLATMNPELEELALEDCLEQHGANLLTSELTIDDDSILKLANCCPYLRRLNLGTKSSLPNVTDESLIVLASKCVKLECVILPNAMEITDRTLKAFAENCLQIETFAVPGCRRLTQDGIEDFIMSLRRLKRMYLSINGLQHSFLDRICNENPSLTLLCQY